MEQNNNKPAPNKLSDKIDSKEDRKSMESEINEKSKIKLPKLEERRELEHITPPSDSKKADMTRSLAAEKGNELFKDDLSTAIEDDLSTAIENDPESNVSPQEREDLRRAANDMPGDDEDLREAALDSTDEDGTPLNVGSFDKNISASDLDVPGADLDDADENIGSEDEENNEYSLGGDDHPNN